MEVMSMRDKVTPEERLSLTDDEHRWRAVQERDARWDGRFVYAVRSTGAYCRPSCPVRRPRRKQVVFFALPETAEQCGYRPCRRCLPQQSPAERPQVELVRRICRYIETHLESSLTLRTLGKQAGVSPFHFQKLFKRIAGITPRQYVDACRLSLLKTRLKERKTVTTAMIEAGYGSSSRLYERASSQLGMTPATYRLGGPATTIRYTVADCPLGRLLLAGTQRGISAIYLGDSDGALEAELGREFPAADVQRDDAELNPWVCAILNHLKGRQPHLDLPLDVRATAFQWRVWQELRKIPYGSTRSYSDIARALGRPSAVRAVARACATNPVSLVIPCHRVLREDGSLGGYRWGLERKQALLDQEKGAQTEQ
jgi:AraC family transcriptional regulator of adaptative response/methylated-DNA-[protein]-cysteine methyltransferase